MQTASCPPPIGMQWRKISLGSRVSRVIFKNCLLRLFLNEYPAAPNFIHNKLNCTMVDIFHQNAFSAICNPESKLRTYALVKTEIGMEKYLVELKNVQTRIKYTKFRLSNHNLMIEKGRYTGMKAHERICPFCTNAVEEELHFLLDCYVY